MSHPSFLILQSISCLQTDALLGSDTLFGMLGPQRFDIGDFSAGDSRDLNIQRPISPGVTQWMIMVSGITGDTVLITIDLLQDMDVDRVVGIFGDRARYDVRLNVQSEPD